MQLGEAPHLPLFEKLNQDPKLSFAMLRGMDLLVKASVLW
jgi:hypothetical protein